MTMTDQDRDAARYRYIVSCTNEQALDLLAEAVGDRERMDSLVDAFMAGMRYKERRDASRAIYEAGGGDQRKREILEAAAALSQVEQKE
jgi:hypothetical protein